MFTRRSWGSFGAAIMGLGIAIIFIVVLVCSVNAQVSIISILVGVAGLMIGFLGVKIASLDRDEEEKEGMLWVDPSLDYHFFLTFRGTEQEITDFSRVEEALIEFDKHRETWKLRIVPPMGTLFEWTGYYDYKKNIYMTERAYAREAGIQRFKIYSEYDGMVKLNQKHLKEIIANLKKAGGQPSS